MIARPTLPVPVPDAVALLAGRQLPAPVQAAVAEVAEAGRLLTVCTGRQYAEARQLLHARLAKANKQLAAHNPGLIHGWADLPSTNR